MSDPKNIQILESLFSESTDFFLDYFYKLELAFKDGLWFKFKPFLGEEDFRRNFHQLLVGFFNDHSNNFMLANTDDVARNHFFKRIPIWINDRLRLEIYEIEENKLILDETFSFQEIPENLTEHCFSDGDLVHQNPIDKYYARFSLVQESPQRIVDVENFPMAHVTLEEKRNEVRNLFIDQVSAMNKLSPEGEEGEKRNRRLQRLQHRLQLWGVDADLFEYSVDKTVKQKVQNIMPYDFGFNEAFELELFKHSLLLPIDNQDVLSSIQRGAEVEKEKIQKLYENVTKFKGP